MLSDLQITTQAKCIIAGEHAVLRGHPALGLPVNQLQLHLTFQASQTPVSAHFSGEHSDTLSLLFWGVLERGLEKTNTPLEALHGKFILDSNLPIGVNLGASAALCVALAQWFANQQLIPSDTIADFARYLEDAFHGESSGIDIAITLAKQIIVFQRHASPSIKPITSAWQPHWYLSPSHQLGVTATCVNQVKALWKSDERRAEIIDNLMHESVLMAIEALTQTNGFSLLCEAISQASYCFHRWNLIPATLAEHIHWLEQEGASAVKPTGAGGGGYVLSLWKTPPPPAILSKLLPINT